MPILPRLSYYESLSAVSPAMPGVELDAPTSTAEAIARHHRVRFFRAGFDKDQAFPADGRPMSAFPFVQINPKSHVNFLVVDVDHEDALVRLLHPAVPEPHWIIENPQNGHAQAGWMIDPVNAGPDARPAPVRYAESIQRSLDRLVDADPHFTRGLVRNPVALHPAGDVRFGSRIMPYGLGDLMEHMQNYQDRFDPEFRAWRPDVEFSAALAPMLEAEVGNRNDSLFRTTRWHLWDRLSQDRLPPTDAEALRFAVALNASLAEPLPEKEVRELAASAVRQVKAGKGRPAQHDGRKNAFLAAVGRKGGQAKTSIKASAAVSNALRGRAKRQKQAVEGAQTALALRAAGVGLEAIAAAVNRSVQTVRRWFRNATDHSVRRRFILQATGSVPVPRSRAQSFPQRSARRVQPDEYPIRAALRTSVPSQPAPHPGQENFRDDDPP